MIALISIGAIVGVLLLNLTALSVLGHRIFGSYVLSKICTPLLLCLVLFCLEHYVGLGDLSWIGVPLTVVAAWLVYRDREVVLLNWRTELLFCVAFGYAFAWRYAFPDINEGSEKLTDLTFIVNYLSGTRLPPPDHWLPPFRYDIYYGFQYYSSALMGRLLRLDPGTTYHLSLTVIAALTITGAGAVAAMLSDRKWKAAVIICALVLGTTGGELLVPLMSDKILISDGVRFMSGFVVPEKMTTEFGKWIFAVSRVSPDGGMQLPSETFSYLVYLGDHHPPMSGFLLLMLALLCIVLIERGAHGPAPAVLGATLPVTIASNSWNVPLQAFLIVAWILWRLVKTGAVPWRYLAVGFAAGMFLVHPFLMGFGPRSLDYGSQIRLISANEHTSILLGLIVFTPYLLILAVALASGDRRSRVLWWALCWVGLLIVSEFVYVDDIYAGKFNRFNTTLKWWPWIMAGIIVTIGPLALSAARRRHRWLTLTALLALMSFTVPLWKASRTQKPHAGHLSGAAWITDDKAEKPILEFLKQQPPSIVLQRLDKDAFTAAPGLIMHAGQTAFLGWPAHEKLWRGNRTDIDTRSAQVRQFYKGELVGAAEWLLENRVDYVLWLKTEAKMPPGSFDRIQKQIERYYFWREYYRAGDFRVGFWNRRLVPLESIAPAMLETSSAATE